LPRIWLADEWGSSRKIDFAEASAIVVGLMAALRCLAAAFRAKVYAC
jgi:hypothetical protein